MESHRENMAGKGLPLGHPDFESDQWSNFFFVCDNVNDDLNEKLSLPKSDFVLDKMFEKMRKIQKLPTDFNGLIKLRDERSVPIRYSAYWYICVNKRNDFFLFPSWSRITSRTGWIYSISRNYSDGSSEATAKLYDELTELVSEKLSSLPKGNWYSIDRIIQTLKSYLTSNNLTPNRSQILSTSDWQNRYLICDKPIVTLMKLEMPKGELGNPFPMKWLVNHFMSENAELPKPEDVALREQNLAPTIVDILNMEKREPRKKMFDGNGLIVRKCLLELGFHSEYDRKLSGPDVKTKLLELSLGYKRPRRNYHEHFSKISENMNSHQMDFDLELRVGEVFEIWIESLRNIAGLSNNNEYIQMINSNVPLEHRFRLPFKLGGVNLFVDYHRKCMNENEDYNRKIKDRLPDRMNRLMSTKAQQMLEILSLMRNRNSHARPREQEIKSYDKVTLKKWLPFLNDFDLRTKRRLIEDFYLEFYGVNENVNVSSVPTLMEVVEFRETNRGKMAVLKCMRNGTSHMLSVSSGSKIITYTDGAKKKISNKKEIRPLQIDDRLFVWATTNPTLVDPVIIRF